MQHTNRLIKIFILETEKGKYSIGFSDAVRGCCKLNLYSFISNFSSMVSIILSQLVVQYVLPRFTRYHAKEKT